MERCSLTNADAAEHVRQTEAELAAHRHQLQSSDDGYLEAVLRDGSQPTEARVSEGQYRAFLRRRGGHRAPPIARRLSLRYPDGRVPHRPIRRPGTALALRRVFRPVAAPAGKMAKALAAANIAGRGQGTPLRSCRR